MLTVHKKNAILLYINRAVGHFQYVSYHLAGADHSWELVWVKESNESFSNHLPLPPQHHPHPGGHHQSEGRELEQLPGGDDGQEDVSQCQEGKKKDRRGSTRLNRLWNMSCMYFKRNCSFSRLFHGEATVRVWPATFSFCLEWPLNSSLCLCVNL